jgi:hypothetical protein
MSLAPQFHRWLLSLALAGTSFLAVGQMASAEVAITGPSPFAACTADNVAGQAGTNFLNAEVEPWVAVDPKRDRRLLAGWQQDRWSNGGSRGNAGAASRDGGVTWSRFFPPGTTLCTGGTYERASDPWTTIGRDGTYYFMSLAFMQDEECADGTTAGGDNAMLVNLSTDGGRSWGQPATLVLDTDGQKFNDKNSMLADPTDKRFVYAVWDKLIDFELVSACPPATASASDKKSSASASSKKIGTRDGVQEARKRLASLRSSSKAKASARSSRKFVPLDPPSPVPSATAENALFTGPTYFVRSVDGGRTWRPERLIFDTGPNAQTINNLVEVTPDGNVYVFFTHILSDGTAKLGYLRSRNKGQTFAPVVYAADMNVTATGTQTPDAKAAVRDANILFDSAVDPDNGNIYLVWQDGRDGDLDKVAFTMSRNKGRTWSEPVIISKTPANANPLRTQAFIPSVEVGKDHKVHVTYYDFRNDTADGKELADFWTISCDMKRGANCTQSSGWGREVRLTSSSFNMLDAPIARGHFLGDYMGLVGNGRKVRSVFGKSVGPNLNDMFFTELPR